MRRFFVPRLQDFFFTLIFFGGLLVGWRMLNTDSDLGRHLSLGGYILSSHKIPTEDILSFTEAGRPRAAYEWVAQVLFASAYRLLNLDGVVLLASLLIAAAFTVVFAHSARRGGSLLVALFLSLWAAAASSLHWLARPHIFTFLFLAIWILELERLRRGNLIRVWPFPALMLLWANTHGGFVYGFLAWAAYFAGWLYESLRGSADRQLGRRLLVAGASSAIASVITPDLWLNWAAVLGNRSSYILSQTAETMPLNPTLPGVWPFLLLVILTCAMLIVERKRVAAAHFLLLVGLGALSFGMMRNIPLFAIASAPLLSEWLASWLDRIPHWRTVEERIREIDGKLTGYVWCMIAVMAAVTLLAVRYFRMDSPLYQFSPSVFPVKAADWLEAHPQQGRMFNDFNWGGYLLFRLWPAQKVFIDSQSDFYGEALTRQSEEIENASPDWEVRLSQFQIGWMIVPRGSGVAQAAAESPAWRLEYEDARAAIFAHR